MWEVPDPEIDVGCLKGDIYNKLVTKLEKNECWREIARKYNTIFDEEELELKSCPSSSILQKLDAKKCKVGQLRTLLWKLNLVDAAAVLSEPSSLVIEVQPGPEDLFIPYGGELKLEVKASGVPPPQYLWHQDNEELPDQRQSVLIVTKFEPQNEGEYKCLVTQDGPSGYHQIFSSSVNVFMRPEPPIIQEQPKSISVTVGNEIVLCCKAVSYPLPKYQWIRGNVVLVDQNSCILKIPEASYEDAGEYKCHITNEYNEKYSDKVTVIVHEPPDVPSNKQRRNIEVEEKLALIIVNASYTNISKLNTPYNDAKALSDILTDLGFKVLTLCDLNLTEMKNAVKTFCSLLPESAYAIVYFAGHGFEFHDKYMLPIDCLGPDMYSRHESLSERYIIREVLKKKPLLLLLMLDMCLILPNGESNPRIFSENVVPIPYEPLRNLILAYATTSNLGAYERRTEPNGIYMKHLLKYLPGDKPVERIFVGVNKSLSEEAADAVKLQIPSFTMNVTPEEHYLTVHCKGNSKTQRDYVQLTNIQPDISIYFPKVKHWGIIKFHFKQKCFHNSLEMHLHHLQMWNIKCSSQSKGLVMTLCRDNDVIILSAMHLQKITTSTISLTISLQDNEGKLWDNAMFDVNISIAAAALWFRSPNMMDGLEEESDISYSSPSQSFYSEEEIPDS